MTDNQWIEIWSFSQITGPQAVAAVPAHDLRRLLDDWPFGAGAFELHRVEPHQSTRPSRWIAEIHHYGSDCWRVAGGALPPPRSEVAGCLPWLGVAAVLVLWTALAFQPAAALLLGGGNAPRPRARARQDREPASRAPIAAVAPAARPYASR